MPIVCEDAEAARMRRAGQRAWTTSTAAPGHQGRAAGGHSDNDVLGMSPQCPSSVTQHLAALTPLLGLVPALGGFRGKNEGKTKKKTKKNPSCCPTWLLPALLAPSGAAAPQLWQQLWMGGHGEPSSGHSALSPG